jgi:hypothetical protein
VADIADRVLPHMKQKYLCLHAVNHKSDLRYGLVFGEARAEAEETVQHRACHATLSLRCTKSALGFPESKVTTTRNMTWSSA